MIVIPLDRRVTKSEIVQNWHPRPQTRGEENKLIEAAKIMIAHGWQPKAIGPEEVGTVETE